MKTVYVIFSTCSAYTVPVNEHFYSTYDNSLKELKRMVRHHNRVPLKYARGVASEPTYHNKYRKIRNKNEWCSTTGIRVYIKELELYK